MVCTCMQPCRSRSPDRDTHRHLGVINFWHFHKRTEITLKGRGMALAVAFTKCLSHAKGLLWCIHEELY